MRNLAFPNPSQPSDQLALIAQAILAVRQAPPTLNVAAVPTGSTNYTYLVVAKSNGIAIPVSASITNGGATLSATEVNDLSWTAPPLNNLTYDVYRTIGGLTQGLVASNLKGLTLVDNGIVATTATPPSFNTSGIMALGTVPKFQNLTATANGAITLPSGIIFITGAAAVAASLPLPLPGTPDQGGQDGASLRIICTTAHAHTVTTPANGYNGANHVLTFAAAGDYQDLVALNGTWITCLAGTGVVS